MKLTETELEMAEAEANKLIALLEKELRMTSVRFGGAFNGGNAILWSGEGSTIGYKGVNVYAFNYSDCTSGTYLFGVHKSLYEWSKKHGFHWESYDPGTFFAYWDTNEPRLYRDLDDVKVF